MSYVAADDILKAKEMDLMTYLQNYEPQELVRVSGNTYCTREHESLRISNGKWYWFSHNIGGKSALDYLIKVKGHSFMDAVRIILGNAAVKEPIASLDHISPLCSAESASPDTNPSRKSLSSSYWVLVLRPPLRLYLLLHQPPPGAVRIILSANKTAKFFPAEFVSYFVGGLANIYPLFAAAAASSGANSARKFLKAFYWHLV